MRNISLAQLTVSGASPADVVSAAAGAGFGQVGLRLEARLPHEDFPHQATRNPDMLRETKRRLIDTGTRVSNVTGQYLIPESTIEDLSRLTDAGAELDAKYIVMVSYDPDEARTADNLARLAGITAKAGMKVALEFITYNFVATLPQAIRIAEATRDPNVGLMIDALHLSRSGASPSDLSAVDKDRLFIAQLCDAKGPIPATQDLRITESRTARLYPGQGDLPLFQFLEAFPASSDIEVEAPHPDCLTMPTNARAETAARASQEFLAAYEAYRARKR